MDQLHSTVFLLEVVIYHIPTRQLDLCLSLLLDKVAILFKVGLTLWLVVWELGIHLSANKGIGHTPQLVHSEVFLPYPLLVILIRGCLLLIIL